MSLAADEWILASTNPGKLAEYRALLAQTPIRLKSLAADDPEAPAETGSSFVENALIKARHAARTAGCPAIADDSGLCVDVLDAAPGVHSARFAGHHARDSDNIRRLLDALAGRSEAERSATFVCVIVALRTPADPAPIIATGRWAGFVTSRPQGTHGFGYDPIFFDPVAGCTAAELSPERKNTVSHRALACLELKRQLEI